jgi:polyhydroxybutyrate depolymerase
MGRRRRLAAAVLLLALLAACGWGGQNPPPGSPSGPAPEGTITVPLGERPFALHVPPTYDPATKAPLVVLLHGFGASGVIQESYVKLAVESDRRGFLYAMPDGTTNRNGKQFWNATAACCDNYRSGVDDVAYLRRVVDTVKATYAVDPARVYLVGHSNGGFMALRMACDLAGEITAVVSLAGAATNHPAQCRPARPVSVLQIHGTKDDTIRFDGDTVGERGYPSVAGTLSLWRGRDGCAERPGRPGAPLDLVTDLAGAETTVTTWTTGCRAGTVVELWSIVDGVHVPALTAGFAPAVVDFLYERVAGA